MHHAQTNRKQGAKVNDETRTFLIDMATYLRGHNLHAAAQDCLSHIDEQDTKHVENDPED